MTVGLNITEACATSHGCFLLLRRPETLQRKETALSLSSVVLNVGQVLEDILPDSPFSCFEAVDSALNCNKNTNSVADWGCEVTS